MAKDEEINTGELPQFSVLRPFEQMAVTLKAGGSTHEQIKNTINAEFGLDYGVRGVEEWFRSGGRLEQAYLEYNGAIADRAIKEARSAIKKAAPKAVDTLVEILGKGYETPSRVAAAKALLNKYIPDRQVISEGDDGEDVPDELGRAGDKVLTGEQDGQNKVDDAPEGAGANNSSGASGGETVPAQLLSEQAATDQSGDTQA